MARKGPFQRPAIPLTPEQTRLIQEKSNMAKAPRTVRPAEDEDIALDESLLTEIEGSDLSEFVDNDEATISLYRVNIDRGGNPAFLTKMLPKQFELESIKQQFGGGRYSARVRVGDRIVRRFQFDIEGPPRIETDKPANAPAPIPAGGDAIQRILDTLERQGRELAELKLRASQPPASNLKEMLEMVTMMRSAFGAPEQQKTPVNELVDVFKSGLLTAAQAQSGGDSIPWLTIIEKFSPQIDKVLSVISNIQARPGLPAQGRPAPIPPVTPGDTSAMPQPTPSATPDPSIPDCLHAVMKLYGQMMVQAASQGKDPALYADLLVDNLPANDAGAVEAFLREEGCLTKLAVIYRPITIQQAWWETFRAEILTAFDEKRTAQEPSGTA
jgi:hypothetical protein